MYLVNLSCISSTSDEPLVLVCRIKIKHLVQNLTWTIGQTCMFVTVVL